MHPDFIHIINNLKPEKYVRNKFNITKKYVIGMIGRFSKDKDYHNYIKAANIILKNDNEITFLCIGYGNNEIYKNIVDPSFIDNIIFIPQQDDIESIMNICDIGVLSTYSEGIPFTQPYLTH